MLWRVPSGNWRVADSYCTSVTMFKWKPRSRGLPFSPIAKFAVLLFGFGGLEWDYDFFVQKKERGGRYGAHRLVLW